MGVAIAFLIFGVPAILYFAGQVIEWRMRNPRKVAPKADPGRIAKLERQLLDDCCFNCCNSINSSTK